MLRDRKKALTRQSLIASAIDLFSTRGFNKTTVDDIVEAAGYSQRTFFRHFASKEDVVFDGLDRLLLELRRILDGTPRGVDPWRALCTALVQITADFTGDDPRLAEVRVKMWFTEPALHAHYGEITQQWERVVRDFLAQRTGADPETDLDIQVMSSAAITALTVAYRLEVMQGGNFQDLARRAFALLDQGLLGAADRNGASPSEGAG